MIIHAGLLPLPPTLIVELASRSGSPTPQSLSPYDGIQRWVFEQFKGYDTHKVIQRLAHVKEDYDADKQKPVEGPYTMANSRDYHLRRLEDIDASWVRKYAENALIGLKLDKRGGVREYDERNREARAVRNQDDETVEEGELLVDSFEYSPLTVAEAKSKLPYLLKRLHDKSIMLRTSVLSLIIAYERARKYASCKSVRPKDVLWEGVYRVDSNGNLTDKYPDSANSGKVFPPAFAWIKGVDRDAYFMDAMELLRVCDVLGIDVTKEDPHDFQAADIARLKVTYITQNRDYLSGSRGYNTNVLADIATMRIEDYAGKQRGRISLSMQMQNTMQAVLDCEDEGIIRILNKKEGTVDINVFFHAYAKVAPEFRVHEESGPRVPTVEDFMTMDGFLCSLLVPQSPQMFRVKKFTCGDIGQLAIMHRSGYLFIVTDGCRIHYQEARIVAKYIEDFVEGDCTGTYDGAKYGRWCRCFT